MRSDRSKEYGQSPISWKSHPFLINQYLRFSNLPLAIPVDIHTPHEKYECLISHRGSGYFKYESPTWVFMFEFIFRHGLGWTSLKRVVVLSVQALLSKRALWTNITNFKSPVFRCRRKTGISGETLRKQVVWTGHKMDIQCLDLGLVVHSSRKVPLRFLLPKIECFYTGCMYFRWNSPVHVPMSKELIFIRIAKCQFIFGTIDWQTSEKK